MFSFSEEDKCCYINEDEVDSLVRRSKALGSEEEYDDDVFPFRAEQQYIRGISECFPADNGQNDKFIAVGNRAFIESKVDACISSMGQYRHVCKFSD